MRGFQAFVVFLIEENLINFGEEHDYKFGERMINFLPVNGVGVLGGMVK